MEFDSPARRRVSAELPTESPGDTMAEVWPDHDEWTNDADAARSSENILRWMSYLPDDCVRTMIDMGWDITT